MKAKNISTQSNQILTYFNQLEKNCFVYADAVNALPQSSDSALKELLSDMVKRGLLMRLKKGTYYIIPFEKDPESFMPDWHLIAEHLVKGADHYIGYYSTLQIHNLITQPSLKEQIVVPSYVVTFCTYVVTTPIWGSLYFRHCFDPYKTRVNFYLTTIVQRKQIIV